jgi:hypothetical protein
VIAALVAVSKMKIYQHTWLNSSNLVKIMTHQFLSEHHVDVQKCNMAIRWLTLLKDNLNICEKHPWEYSGIITALLT